MTTREPDRFAEIKRCLAKAEAAFTRAGACETENDRLRLIEEAEDWLVRAERAFARLNDRASAASEPRPAVLHEHRSFGDPARTPRSSVVWREPDRDEHG